MFSRVTQQVGLVVVAVLTGVAVGVLFGIVYAMLDRADPERDSWRRALRLAGPGSSGSRRSRYCATQPTHPASVILAPPGRVAWPIWAPC